MVTQTQASVWLTEQIGKKLDFDKKYGCQCVDFFNFYYQFITGDNPYNDGYGVPGAKDLWTRPNSHFTNIPDSNTLKPQPGDVLVYGSSWGLGYGHVEVCLSSDTKGSWVVGENEHGNPSEGVIKVYRTWAQMKGLLGVMRPKFTVPAAPKPAPAPAPKPAPVTKDGKTIEQWEDAANQANLALNQANTKVQNLTDVNSNLNKQIASLTAQLATASGDTAVLNNFGKALTALIVRLGIK